MLRTLTLLPYDSPFLCEGVWDFLVKYGSYMGTAVCGVSS